MSCGVSRRHSMDPMLLWLWYSPLAWEFSYAVGEAQKNQPNKKCLQILNVGVVVEKREPSHTVGTTTMENNMEVP